MATENRGLILRRRSLSTSDALSIFPGWRASTAGKLKPSQETMAQEMIRILFAVLLCACANAGFTADLEVKSAWVRATVPAQMASGAFMDIASKGNATLVGVSTPVAEDAEVHEMRLEGGIMKMRAAPRLALPAGKTVSLKPGGYHIMLMGLKQQLKPGDTVHITLKIENAKKKIESVAVSANVRELTSASDVQLHHTNRSTLFGVP